MDIEVLRDLHSRALRKGYNKSIEDFGVLINSDEEVLNDNYIYVRSKGYGKTIDDFKNLLKLDTIKKKEDSDLPSEEEDTLLDTQETEVQEPTESSQDPQVDFTTKVPSFAEAVPAARMPIQPTPPQEDDKDVVSSFIEETRRKPEALELERTDKEKRLPSSISSGPVENMFPEKVTESSFIFDGDNLNILEKISNSGVAMGMLANRIDTESADNIDFEELAYYNRVLDKNQVGSKERNLVGFLKDIAVTLPQSLISQIIAAPSAGAEAAAGAAAGSVVPGVGTLIGGGSALAGVTSLNIEYAMSLMQSLRDAGVDVTNGKELKKAFENEDILKKAREYAEKRSTPIAVLDGLSAGIGGSIASSIGKSTRKKLAAETAEQTVQATLGGTGEFLGQKAVGEETDWYSIALEAVSDPASQIVGRTVRAIQNKATSPEEKDYLLKIENEPGVSVRTDIAYLNNKDIVQLNKDIQTLRESKRKAKSVGLRKTISDELKSKRKEKYARINEELEKTKNLSEEEIEKAEDLIKDINDLKNAYNESENKEEKRIIKEAIQKKKGEINNAVQEQITDEVPVRDDAEVSEEVEEGVPETELEEPTEKVEEEEVNFGTAFEQQDESAEVTVGKQKDKWGEANFFREKVENAGDILRELSSRGKNPDPSYILEKVAKIKDWLAKSKEGFEDIPNDIKTLDEFSKSNLRFTNAIDGWNYAKRFYNDILTKTLNQYKAIDTYTEEQRLARDLVVDLLNNDINGVESKISEIENIANKVKEQGELPIVEKISRGIKQTESKVSTEEGIKEGTTEQAAIEEALTEEEARPIEERKPRIQAIEEDSSKIRKVATKKTFTAKQATELKKELRKFINDYLPKAMFTTTEVKKILNEVQKATIKKNYYKLVEKPKDDIREVMSKVLDLVNDKSSKIYMAEVKGLMDVKTEKKESSRLKGKFTAEGVDRINQFKEDMSLDDKSPFDEVDKKIEDLTKEKQSIEDKVDLTEEDLKRLEMIDIALLYNGALNMDNKSQSKSISLEEVARKIKIVLSGARSEFRESQKKKHEYYKSLQEEAIEAISGKKINISNKEEVSNLSNELAKKENIEKNRSKIKKLISNIFKNFDFFIKRIEATEGLLDRISIDVASSFGGKLKTIFEDRIGESSRNFKKNKKESLEIIQENAKEIYGDNWKNKIKENNKKKYDIYLDKKKIDSLNEKLKNTKSKKEKRKIVKEIESNTLPLTQNEMYYFYNQYKDPANHPGFESIDNWGKNTADIMSQIDELLTEETKRWADWQVEVFFPSLYEKYNKVYRNIYNTNLPWNENYAGRIYREGDTKESDLYDLRSKEYQNSIGGASTKARVKNDKAIQVKNGDQALIGYINDMEFFSSYAETSRDLQKVYKNKVVKNSIEKTTSKDTYDVIFGDKGIISKTLNPKLLIEDTEGNLINMLTPRFATSVFGGFNPTIFLKQLTSAIAFSDYIGYRNWNKYFLKELKNGIAGWNSTWKELYENSTELQERYDSKDFTRVIESYNASDLEYMSGGISMGSIFDKLLWFVKTGDKGGVMGSIPNYSFYKDQFKKKNPKATEQQAIDFSVRKVEKEIKTTQQDQDIQNKDFYQTGNWYQRWLSMFQSSPRALLRKEIIAIRNLYRKLVAWDKTTGKGTLKENIRTFLTYHVGIPMVFQYVSIGLPGLLKPWDEEDEDDLILSAILGNINSVFLLGNIVETISDFLKGNPWAGQAQNLPILDMISKFFKGYTDFNDAKKQMEKLEKEYPVDKMLSNFDTYRNKKQKIEQRMNKSSLRAITSAIDVTGLPATQTNKYIQNLIDIYEGKDYKLARGFGFTDYQLKPKKRKPKKVDFKNVKTIDVFKD